MVDQTNRDSVESSSESTPQARAKLADLLDDIVQLGELQRQLFVADLRQAGRLVRLQAVLLALGVLLAASCVPLALVTVALLLVEFARMGYAAAFACTFILALFGAAGLIGASLRWFSTGPRLFQRSAAEWTLNLQWLKEKLRRLKHPLRRASSS